MGDTSILGGVKLCWQMLQSEMAGEAERTGLTSDEDIMEMIKELQNEDENI